jgi:uncharacterized protein (TIGR02145 family)
MKKIKLFICLSLLMLISFLYSANAQVTDVDGNIYKSIQIGNQHWMGENLNVSHFRNGDPIPQAKTFEAWRNAGSTGSSAWCYYNNDPENGKLLGRLYNWYAVNDKRGLAPLGWHIPSDNEWKELIDSQGGKENAAIKMKSMRLWKENGNERLSGMFEALPGGVRLNGKFKNGGNIGAQTYWWGTIEDEEETTNAWGILYYTPYVVRYGWKEETGISVRCIRN